MSLKLVCFIALFSDKKCCAIKLLLVVMIRCVLRWVVHRHRETVYQGCSLIHHHQLGVFIWIYLGNAFRLGANRHVHLVLTTLIPFKRQLFRRNLRLVLVGRLVKSSPVEPVQLFFL
jgi:hypothetical protein